MAGRFLGIDLGTTSSAAAIVRGGKSVLVPTRAGGRLNPSMVGFLPNGERVVGEAARALLETHPENVAASTKRFIGRRFTPELAEEAKALVPYPIVAGPSGEIRAQVAGRTLPLAHVAAMILGEIKLDAEAFLGEPLTHAVITVPANFDDGQRQATKEAAQIAGIEVVRMVNEPTAAAVAFGLTKHVRGLALVFDLGGGTFDVSVLDLTDGTFHVVATGGDAGLGGDDFDALIVRWMLEQIPEPMRGVVEGDRLSMQRLRFAAERAKCELSTHLQTRIQIYEIGDHRDGNFIRFDAVLERKRFEELCEPLVRRCLEVCEDVMVEAHTSPNKIDALLLVGGMTRMPLIRSLVSEYFGRKPEEGVGPDEAVAMGAALIAAEQSAKQKQQSVLRDVASHSLGIAILGGKMQRLIEKNTSLPVSATETFLPSRSGQERARIAIYQGQSRSCPENTFLGEVVLDGLRGATRADNELKVTFELAPDGMLSVKAVDVTTGSSQALTIQARTELGPADVERLRKEEAVQFQSRVNAEKQFDRVRFQQLLTRGRQLQVALRDSVLSFPNEGAKVYLANLDSVLLQAAGAQDSGDWSVARELTAQLEHVVGEIERVLRPTEFGVPPEVAVPTRESA